MLELLQITDPHLYADESRRLYGLDTALTLRLVLDAALGEGRPDAILVTGDIGDDCSAAAYGRFRRVLQDAGAPVYCVAGNHDDPQAMAGLLADAGFQYCGRARLGGFGLVMLDTHLPGEPGGRLSAAELARLDADVRSFGDAPVIVGMHHPPVPVGSPWLDACGLANGDDFLAVIGRLPQVRVVVAGHVHQEFDECRGAARILTTPSTCAQFTPRTLDCVMDPRPPGYRRIRLHADGTVTTRVGRLPGAAGTPWHHADAPLVEESSRRGGL